MIRVYRVIVGLIILGVGVDICYPNHPVFTIFDIVAGGYLIYLGVRK